MRARYRRRRDVLVQALERELPEARIGGIAAGLHIVVELPRGTDEERVLAEARKREIGLYGLGEHRFRSRRGPALLLGYAVAREPAIRAAVRALAEAVEASKP